MKVSTQQELNKIIDELNADTSVHGILVQLPLPKHLSEFATTSRISPIKDVDGLTPHNAGLIIYEESSSCCMYSIRSYGNV